ncbi:MAG TPA: P44/Msp2 family outer membrane protein [Rhizomicrobium sp.]|jgi:OOP family OmpA-OmpF porin|nr:P44/Msp2 family outer membrane protein [Rhizomicrobium sp.]
MAYRKALIAGVFWTLWAAAPAAADPYTSPHDQGSGAAYLGLRGSIVDGDDTHASAGAVDLKAHYSTGLGGSLYAGARLDYGFRIEGELVYRHFSLDSLSVAGTPQAGRTGFLQIAAPMANVYWDVPIPEFPLRPFIGAGLGAAYVDAHDRIGANPVIAADNWHFAYQLMAGAAIPLSQDARLTGLYRFFRVQDASYRCTPPALPTAACRADTMNSSIDLGLEFDL